LYATLLFWDLSSSYFIKLLENHLSYPSSLA
jgi:hypothetical protein